MTLLPYFSPFSRTFIHDSTIHHKCLLNIVLAYIGGAALITDLIPVSDLSCNRHRLALFHGTDDGSVVARNASDISR